MTPFFLPLLGSRDYGPYGELWQDEWRAAWAQDALATGGFGFSTEYHDVTGHVYYGFRHYSPKLGRFISRDPMGESAGPNLYRLAGGDPVNMRDLWGLCEWDPSNGQGGSGDYMLVAVLSSDGRTITITAIDASFEDLVGAGKIGDWRFGNDGFTGQVDWHDDAYRNLSTEWQITEDSYYGFDRSHLEQSTGFNFGWFDNVGDYGARQQEIQDMRSYARTDEAYQSEKEMRAAAREATALAAGSEEAKAERDRKRAEIDQLMSDRERDQREDNALMVERLSQYGQWTSTIVGVGAGLRANANADAQFRRGEHWRTEKGKLHNWDKTRKSLTRGMKDAQKRAKAFLARGARIGRGFGIFGAGLALFDLGRNPSPGNAFALGAAVAAVAITGPVGVGIGIGYLLVDVGSKVFTGKSLAANIDESIGFSKPVEE